MRRSPPTTPAVLIGGEHIALAVARSLAAAGVDVYALGSDDDPLRHSRSCREFVGLGTGTDLQEASLAWLEHDGPRGAVVIPCDDEPLEMLARHRRRLQDWGYMPIATDDEVVLAMLNKERTYELAAELEVEAPRSTRVRSADEAMQAGLEIGFPCALKPLASHEWARQFPLHTKALMARDRAELARIAEQWGSLSTEVMMTEFIPGADDGCWAYLAYLTADGQALMEATKRRLRQYLPGFGSSTFTLLQWQPEVARQGLRFLQGVGAQGPVYVEFKRDPRDGRLKLIECNHRFTGPTQLLRRGGLDLPLLTYNRTLGITGPAMPSRRDGIALWAPWLDFRAFLAYRAQGEETFGGWLASLRRPLCFPVWSWRDPKPGVVRAWSRLLAAVARRTRRLRR